jgi:hypothetical protein
VAPSGAPGVSGASTPGVVNATKKSVYQSTLSIFHLNVQGFTPKNIPKLIALISTLKHPDIIAITETWLKPYFEPTIPGYICVEKRNRNDGRGGVALFSKSTEDIVCVMSSSCDERLWFIIHADIGPLLLCVWYRRPVPESESCVRFFAEYNKLCGSAIGFIGVGDHNYHNRRWLKFSSEDTAEGKLMESMCSEVGFRQLVSAPTHFAGNLLDLVLTDLGSGITAKVMSGIHDTDHYSTLTTLRAELTSPYVDTYSCYN